MRVWVLLLILVSPWASSAQSSVIRLTGAKDPVTDISAKVLEEAYRRLHIPLVVRQYPSARSLASANKGLSDGEIGRVAGIEPDYPNLLRIPVPINVVEGVVFSKNQQLEISDWQSLSSYTIGIKRGDIFIERGTQGMTVVPVADSRQLLLMLDKGRTDVVVLARVTGLVKLKNLYLDSIHIIEPAMAKVELFHYLHKKHQHLVPGLTAVLETMQQNGFIQQLRDKALMELRLPEANKKALTSQRLLSKDDYLE